MTKPKTEHSYEKDYICHDCAVLKQGWKPVEWNVTIHEGVCPYCDKKKSLVSVNDYVIDGKVPAWD